MPILEIVYVVSAALLAAYGFNALFFTWKRTRLPENTLPPPFRWLHEEHADCPVDHPIVTVQLPIYNERYVAARLIEAVARFNWPRHALEIQVLDDSNDDTTAIVAEVCRRHAAAGIQITHIHRSVRHGYKAGALQAGLALASGALIAIFDADFIPSPDFLQRVIPSFSDPDVGCVQTRWGHVNRNSSRLTQAQALGIDGHFYVEQTVRDHLGAFLNFNGTAGVWRRTCMNDSGGWQGDTLTEDLDLSYRAQLRGWRIRYRGDIEVPAELPVQLDAFKRQQFRWAKGSIQTAIKLLPAVWRADEAFWRKILSTIHLTNYLVHPLMILNLALLLPMSLSYSWLLYISPFLATAAVGPPLMYWSVLRRQPMQQHVRISQLLTLMVLGTGLSLNNTRAVLEAITGISSEFKRTPKFAITESHTDWQSSTYTLPRNPIVWLEFGLFLYALGLLIYCVTAGIWWMVLWVLLYASGYGVMVLLTVDQARQMHSAKLTNHTKMTKRAPLEAKHSPDHGQAPPKGPHKDTPVPTSIS